MFNDEGWLHDCRKLNIAVSLMLPLELVQEGLIGCLWKAVIQEEESALEGPLYNIYCVSLKALLRISLSVLLILSYFFFFILL